ncbi:MAG TPA: hypothetical protein VMV86_03400 [Methanosarcinales archaeon]|nr:hypothetical protein [Methanosarcinales archaeon]
MIPEGLKIVEAIRPQAGAAIEGDYINLKNVEMAWIVIQQTGGAAVGMGCIVNQATADLAALTPIVNVVPIWANLDTATSDTLVRVTVDAVNYTTDVGLTHKIVVFQIDPAKLSAGYSWLQLHTNVSDALNITSAVYVLKMKYKSTTPPSVV